MSTAYNFNVQEFLRESDGNHIEFSPNRLYIFSYNYSTTVCIYNAESLRRVGVISLRNIPKELLQYRNFKIVNFLNVDEYGYITFREKEDGFTTNIPVS